MLSTPNALRSGAIASKAGLYLSINHYHEGSRQEIPVQAGDALPKCSECGEEVEWTFVARLLQKDMVWSFGERSKPDEEQEKRRLSAKRVEEYYREINRAHSLENLRDVQDRIVVDDQLAEEDKLALCSRIMETRKIIA